MPAAVPMLRLSAKPASAPSAVVSSEPSNSARSVSDAERMAEGGGSKNAGTCSARTPSSQALRPSTNESTGGAATRSFSPLGAAMVLQRAIQDGRLCHERHARAQRGRALCAERERAIEHD